MASVKADDQKMTSPTAGEEPDREDRDDGNEKGRKETAFDRAPTAPSYFTIYKKGQGKWTRLGTVAAAMFLGAMTAYSLAQYIPTWTVGGHIISKNAAITAAMIFLALFAFLVFHLTNKPKNVDFLIATDSEMKKVNWTSGDELFGSTRVVIFFVIFLAVSLFVIDLVFAKFFALIGVLQFSTGS